MRDIRNCSAAVIGGAGFLGSHLVKHLVEDRGCRVLVVDNLASGRREFVHPRAKFVHHDITDAEWYVRALFEAERVKFVFNYAAWPYVPDSYARPGQVFAVNLMGAVKVINAAQEAGAEAVLQVSSAEVYGSWEYNGQASGRNSISECDEVRPYSSYGASKAAVDAYCQCAWKERATPVIALRQFNCVGERETHPYVVPEIISQLVRGSDQTVQLGNNSRRDFMYAGDAVEQAVLLLERGQFGEAYNLGSEESIHIYDLVQMLSDVLGTGRATVKVDDARKRRWEVWHLQSDNAKLRSALGPVSGCLPLKAALKRAVAWFLTNGQCWPWEV